MFKCKECGSTEFNLVIDPNFTGKVDISKNEHDEVLISAGNQEFIADLMFMNQFAVCTCGEIRKWEYFFPNLKPA
ncbi:MAG: hypothetical protein K2X66_00095 [Cyanobacteria bacterium]|jgi:hypothetical protein|nr:hypothetical protein [Cyanobacteriota bacterium]